MMLSGYGTHSDAQLVARELQRSVHRLSDVARRSDLLTSDTCRGTDCEGVVV
jgi:hypothetical protein